MHLRVSTCSKRRHPRPSDAGMVDLTDVDWSEILAPEDDGAARHLSGMTVASLPLTATDGARVDLAKLRGRAVVYAYPRTGEPDVAPPADWDLIPGARGCTAESCSFRDHFAELRLCGVTHLFGLSTQDTDYQHEAATRLHLPFPLLSDEGLSFGYAMRLPTFEAHGMTLFKRLTLVIQDGVIERVFYPVFPPDQHSAEVMAWLRDRLV